MLAEELMDVAFDDGSLAGAQLSDHQDFVQVLTTLRTQGSAVGLQGNNDKIFILHINSEYFVAEKKIWQVKTFRISLLVLYVSIMY